MSFRINESSLNIYNKDLIETFAKFGPSTKIFFFKIISYFIIKL